MKTAKWNPAKKEYQIQTPVGMAVSPDGDWWTELDGRPVSGGDARPEMEDAMEGSVTLVDGPRDGETVY